MLPVLYHGQFALLQGEMHVYHIQYLQILVPCFYFLFSSRCGCCIIHESSMNIEIFHICNSPLEQGLPR
ncbi:hypothetical protein AB3S75_001367 [Citrus x aurantiifolia]